MASLDPRLHPYRHDLAAAHLKGLVPSSAFVAGKRLCVGKGLLPMRKSPSDAAEQVNELRYGDGFTVYEEKHGWAWGQAARDDYVGYVRMDGLCVNDAAPTHRIKTASSFIFPEPSIKAPPKDCLTYITSVAVTGQGDGSFAALTGGGFVHKAHLLPIAETLERDFVFAAGRFLGAPYLWGGISPLGCDCSGLVQAALQAAGIKAPRDSDMQAEQLGTALSGGDTHYNRGDLVFFKGHVGIMVDTENLLHANAFHGRTVVEPLADVVARGSAITVVRRF